MGLLNGKAIVITGSGRGIGEACVKGAARQGASVVVNDVDAEFAEKVAADIRAEGGSAIACAADITDWDQAGQLIDTCIGEYGRIDGLVNNAGLFHINKFLDYDPVAARALIDVNVMGTLNCAARAVKPMVAQGSGSIVNITSGAHMGLDSMSVYGASKGAVASMVYGWALELRGSGVRVNAFSPLGATRMTEVTGDYMVRAAAARRGDSAEVVKSRHETNVQPAEANSPPIEFLLSDRAEGISGQIVRLDGGNLQIYTHPALLLPPIHRDGWTADDIADVFDAQLRDKLVPCGVQAMKEGPVPVTTGYWRETKD